MSDELPEMTDRLGKYWDQPNRDLIAIDKTHAVMELEEFDRLSEYSTTNPSGVYVGKMWKRWTAKGWYLCWYGRGVFDDSCSNNLREILVC